MEHQLGEAHEVTTHCIAWRLASVAGCGVGRSRAVQAALLVRRQLRVSLTRLPRAVTLHELNVFCSDAGFMRPPCH
jgi:hypothetical protein